MFRGQPQPADHEVAAKALPVSRALMLILRTVQMAPATMPQGGSAASISPAKGERGLAR